MSEKIKVMIVEDHIGYREVLEMAIQRQDDLELVHKFGTAEMALRKMQNCPIGSTPDFIFLDLNLPRMSGLEAIPWLHKYLPKAKIIVLTQSDHNNDILTAITQGVAGYLLKSSTIPEIIESIHTVINGGASIDASVAKDIIKVFINKHKTVSTSKKLSKREQEVLLLLGEGFVKKEIGQKLSISATTVAYHVKNIYEKLNVQNAAAAINVAYKEGIFPKSDQQHPPAPTVEGGNNQIIPS